MRQLSTPYTRVQAPAGLNYTPETFKRRMSDKARDADPWHKPEKKHGGWRYLGALVLLGMAALVGLTGCSKADGDASGSSAAVQLAEAKRAAAGAWNCPGMHAEWLDDKTVQCLKEKP